MRPLRALGGLFHVWPWPGCSTRSLIRHESRPLADVVASTIIRLLNDLDALGGPHLIRQKGLRANFDVSLRGRNSASRLKHQLAAHLTAPRLARPHHQVN